MELFLRILRYVFYGFAALCLVFFVLYKISDPVNEDYFQYFIYSGLAAIGCSVVRFFLRFI